jgi:hypothetical protein
LASKRCSLQRLASSPSSWSTRMVRVVHVRDNTAQQASSKALHSAQTVHETLQIS